MDRVNNNGKQFAHIAIPAQLYQRSYSNDRLRAVRLRETTRTGMKRKYFNFFYDKQKASSNLQIDTYFKRVQEIEVGDIF